LDKRGGLMALARQQTTWEIIGSFEAEYSNSGRDQ
jgi:hypothetical protein